VAAAAIAGHHIDPVWLAEQQRRYMASAAGPPMPPSSHIPGVYPPPALTANMPPDVLQRERERIGNYWQQQQQQ